MSELDELRKLASDFNESEIRSHSLIDLIQGPYNRQFKLYVNHDWLEAWHAEFERILQAIAAWNHRAATTTHAVIVSDKSTDCATGHCECELCGEPIDPWDKYCRHCGAKVEQ